MFTPTEVDAARDGLVGLTMGKNPAFTGITFDAAAETILSTLSPEQRQDAVRKASHFVNFEARLKAISHHAKLLAVVRMLISDREPELFQDMALVQPPRLGRQKPWHQDHAYFDYPLGTPVVGVWIALDAATIENGCMQLLPVVIARDRSCIFNAAIGRTVTTSSWARVRSRLRCRRAARPEN